MSQEKRRRFLEQSALREAQKAIRSRGDSFKKEDLGRLRIQTLEPWKRIVALLIGIFFSVLTFIAIRDEYHVVALILFPAFGLLFIGAGVWGYRKPVDAVIDAAADAAFSRILDAIF
jgi:hypothetical protein